MSSNITRGAARPGIVILAVEDLPRSVRCYHRAIGWQHRVDSPNYVQLQLPVSVGVGIYERHGFRRNTGHVPSQIRASELAPTELYLYVDDHAAAVARLQRAGGRLLSPATRDWSDEVAYLIDLDGNVRALARAGALQPAEVTPV